jgi:drug/metabolite transporter (DMT)-like permease
MHTALLFMTPLFGTIIAMLFLKEKARLITFATIAIGFVGVLVITRPDFATFNIGILFALLAAAGFAGCGATIKSLTNTEPGDKIAFYMLSMTTLIALPFALANWTIPQAEDAVWFIAIGLIAVTLQIAIAAAFGRASFMTLLPLNFAQLVFVSIIAFIFYDEIIDEWTIVGSLLIIGATMANGWCANRQTQEIMADAIEAESMS